MYIIDNLAVLRNDFSYNTTRAGSGKSFIFIAPIVHWMKTGAKFLAVIVTPLKTLSQSHIHSFKEVSFLQDGVTFALASVLM